MFGAGVGPNRLHALTRSHALSRGQSFPTISLHRFSQEIRDALISEFFNTISLYPRYAQAGLLQAYDDGMLKNTGNLLLAFQNVAEVMDGSARMGIPIAWGSQGLIYDADEFSEPPTSWAAMWDPANAQRVISLDDSNNNIVMAALLLGFDDPFNLSDDQMTQVRDKLIELKGNLLSYYAGFDEGVSVWESGAATMMLSMGEPQIGLLLERGYNAVYSIPSEGAVGWLDTWAMSVGAKDMECAHAWADYMLRPEVGTELIVLKNSVLGPER
ncbi:MAG: extracellular solute-binding protein [Rhodobacteraceae bacterium]|nr:extracellular solute-binding protein [Paracoccaceae bacterium]